MGSIVTLSVLNLSSKAEAGPPSKAIQANFTPHYQFVEASNDDGIQILKLDPITGHTWHLTGKGKDAKWSGPIQWHGGNRPAGSYAIYGFSNHRGSHILLIDHESGNSWHLIGSTENSVWEGPIQDDLVKPVQKNAAL